jgi:Fasciclin domain
MRFTKEFFLLAFIFAISFTGCKKWENHIAVNNQDLTQDLYRTIANNPSLSMFAEFISRTGLDTLLRSSETYTVWAPSNDAMASVDPSVLTDPARLKSFLLNHISNQSYFTKDAVLPLRIAMLNGKYNNFQGNKFDDATITTADKYVKNGVLHIIDKIVPVLPSIWEFLNSTTAQYKQNAFIAGLNYNDFDPNLAIIDSISSATGLPVYHPGTGLVNKNSFTEKVYNIKNENKQYTYFVIQDAGFTLESDSLKPYFATTSLATTDSLIRWNTVKDLVVEGIYPPTAFAGLISRSGIPIPVNPAFIIETKKLSNGIVYVLSKVDVVTASKFKPITIQGENPAGFLLLRPTNTFYRVRPNPVTSTNFTDILVTGHGVTTFYAYYRLTEIPSIKYKVYAFGVNDFQTGALTQNIIPKYLSPAGVYTTLATLPHVVPLHTAPGAYNELYLGEFTSTIFGTLEIQLTCLTTQPIVLDYLRLVPVP